MNVDNKEVQKFDDISYRWWDPEGPFKPLHMLNPVRVNFIKNSIDLKNKSLIDVGCGGGLLTEPLKRLGANVTGLDASPEAIEVAREHALVMELDIDYRIGDLSVISNRLDQFDVVIASEVIEHVSDPQNFIHEIDKLTFPGGRLIITTLNRSLLSLLGAKVFAEYILKICLLYTSPSPRDKRQSRMPSSA